MSILPANITIIRSLAAYLLANVTDLDQVIEEFPAPNVELDFPSVSIITAGKVEEINFPPTVESSSDTAGSSIDLDVVYQLGQYNHPLQLDLWCQYKEERGAMLELVRNAINKQFIDDPDLPLGLSLTLTDYYSAIARYDWVGYTYVDGEEGSRLGEWRAKIDLLATYPRLTGITKSKIKEGKVYHNIDTNNIDDTDSNEEEIEIFA